MNEQFRIAQATGAGNSNNASPPRIFKLTKPFADQAVVLNLGYDQKVQVDFSAIANEKITLVHVGEKLIILFDNHSTVTVEPFFDSRHDQLGNLTIQVAPGRDLSVAEFASAFPIINDPSAASAVLPAAGDSLGQNNAQASGANFSPFTVDPLPPVPTNTLAPQEELPTFQVNFPTGFVPQTTTSPAPTIALGTLPNLIVDESFLTSATNGIDGTAPGLGSTVVSGLLPVTLNVPGGQQSLTFALSISAPGVDTGLIDSQTGNHVFLFVEGGVVVGREGANVGAAAGGLKDFTISVDAAGNITLTDLRSVHENNPSDSNEGISLAAGLVTLTATVTDNSNQSASASADVGPHLTILDDGPIASTVTGATDTLVLDESKIGTDTLGGAAPVGLATFTAKFGDNFSGGSYGADGAGSTVFKLVLTGSNVASGLYALDPAVVDPAHPGQGTQIVLNQSGDTISGTANGTTYFTITVDESTGDVTFTQLKNIWHPNKGDSDDAATLTTSAGLLQIVQTITDADGDHVSTPIDLSTGVFAIQDDGPTAGHLSDVFRDQLVLDESAAGTDTTGGASPLGRATFTANFADNFTSGSYGTDGPGTTKYTLTLNGQNVASGLYALDPAVVDPAHPGQGTQIVLNLSGDTISGTANGLTYFTITIDETSGDVTFTQLKNLWHPNKGDSDDQDNLSLAANTLQVVQTITDADGDHVSTPLDLSTGVFAIQDDGPTAGTVKAAADQLILDESAANTDTVGASLPPGVATFTANFADNFTSGSYGTDGPGTTKYTLTLNGQNVASGLYALDPAVVDPAHPGQGTQIVLNLSGDTISGTANGLTYFTITIDETSGDVTFTQLKNLWHPNKGDSDDQDNLSLAANTLQVVQTITDADGDHVSTPLDLSTGVFAIQDDGPTAGTVKAAADQLILDESAANTDTVGASLPPGVATFTANFADNFTSGSYGTDGPGTTKYTLTLNGQNVASGLYALDPAVVDPAHPGQGTQIVLNLSGDTISGTANGLTYFTITIDETSGDVTFTQLKNLWHPNKGDSDDQDNLSLAANTLQVVQTITDADGDHVSTPLDLSTGVFAIQDDGPTAGTVKAAADQLILDESAANTDTVGASLPPGVATFTANFADNFTSGSYGTDGPGTTKYTLTLNGQNVASGLYALDPAVVDPAHPGQGTQIVLNLSGDTISGTANGLTYFTITIDETSGDVTFTQLKNLWHPNKGDSDDQDNLSLAANTLQVVQTITDADGDHVSTPLDLSTGVFAIQDDGPTAGTVKAAADQLILDESAANTDTVGASLPPGVATFTANFADNFTSGSYGTDGPGTTKYTLTLNGQNVASGLYALDPAVVDPAHPGQGTQIVLNLSGDTISGTANGLTYFTITIDETSGDVTFTQLKNLWHPNKGDSDDQDNLSLAANTLQVVQTITDADGDHVSTPLDLSTGVFAIQDDGPTAGTVKAAADQLILDESAANTDTVGASLPPGVATFTANFADNFTSGSYGTDGPGTTKYTLTLNGQNVASGLYALDPAVVDPAHPGQGTQIVLNLSGDTISGTANGLTYFTITIDETSGDVTFTQLKNLWHPNKGDSDDQDNLSLAANTLQVVQTITDADGDHVSTPLDLSTGVFAIQDDGPTAGTVKAAADQLILDESAANTDTVGASLPPGVATFTANFADNFTSGSYGTDGPGTTKYTLTLNGQNVASGLYALDPAVVDPAHPGQGTQIVLNLSGDTISGTANGLTYFTITIDETSGDVTFTQLKNLWHPNKGDSDDQDNLSLAANTLQVVQTITDADGDHVSTPLDLSTGVFAIQDDGPTAGTVKAAADQLILDESAANTDTVGASLPPGVATFTANFADNFTSGSYGTDGPGTTKYTLTLNGQNVASGLYALDPAVVDPAHPGQGTQIVLNLSGDTISGTANGLTYFTITIDETSGDVTFTQLKNLWHPNKGDSDDQDNLSLAANTLQVVQTITDADGDHVSTPLDLSTGVFAIQDDGPTAGTVKAAADQLILDESAANTDTVGASLPPGVATFTANFADNFTSGSYGTDGPGTTKYTLTLNGQNVASGLYALDPAVVDPAHPGQGTQIVLNLSGDTISGTANGQTYFTITIDETSGDVTFTQLKNLWHPNKGDSDDQDNLSLAANTLQVVQTITDADGDHVSTPLDLSTGVFAIQDDGPTAGTVKAAADQLILDESAANTDTVGASLPPGVATFTANFADNFTSGSYGTDGPGTTKYTLTLNGQNVASGLYALDPAVVDPAHPGQGTQIVLNLSGDTISGTANGLTYFTITIDETSGDVTFTQLKNLWHPNKGDSDDQDNLSLAANTLQVVQTITDADGDHVSTPLDLSTGVFAIQDDGPTAGTVKAAADQLILDESAANTDTVGASLPPGVATFTANFADNFTSGSYGTDGPGTTKYTLTLNGQNVASGLYALDPAVVDPAHPGQGTQIVLNLSGDTISGTANGLTYFTITIDETSGDVTFTQLKNLWHPNKGDSDDQDNLSLAANTLQVVQTITDADGDHVSTPLDLSTGVFAIQDDGPTAGTVKAAADQLILDESAANTDTVGASLPPGVATFTANFADNFTSGSYGTDGPGTTKYTLTLNGQNVASGLYALDPAVVDPAHPGQGTQIVLNLSGDTISGTANGLTYFTITIDETSGDVTFTQLKNLWHPNKGDSDDQDNLSLAANTLQVVQTITDADGDHVSTPLDLSTGVFAIQDDGPTAPTIAVSTNDPILLTFDGGLTGGNFVSSQAAGDQNLSLLIATQNYAGVFSINGTNYGTDGAGTTTFTNYALGFAAGFTPGNAGGHGTATGLTHNGSAIYLYNIGGVITGSTALAQGGVSGTNTIFTVSLSGSNVTLTQSGSIDHSTISTYNGTYISDLQALAAGILTLTATAVSTDADGDQASNTATLDLGPQIRFGDDGPQVVSHTDLIYANGSNPTPGGTGVYIYNVGADHNTYTDAAHSDFAPITLSGTVGGVAITTPTVTWQSEDSHFATFGISFSYAPNPATPGVTIQDTGTLVFDKVAGTYTMELTDPIQSVTIVNTSGANVHFQGYQNNSLNQDNSGPAPYVVAQLDTNFFVQFSGSHETNNPNVNLTSGPTNPGDGAFANGDLFWANPTDVTVSSSALGVASNTLQPGEVLNMNFYTADPHGIPGSQATAYASGIYLEFFNIGTKDLVVNLELVGAGADNTFGTGDDVHTTKAVVVDNADIYTSVNQPPAGYPVPGGNDGIVIIDSYDWNGVGQNYLLTGVQVVTSTQSITGSGINLDPAVGAAGASSGTETFGSGGANDTSDNDNIKIISAGFIETSTTTQDANLTFQVTNLDSDGDKTTTQTVNVTVEGSTSFVGTSAAESIQGTTGIDIITGNGGNDLMKGNGGNDVFVLQGSSANGHDTLVDFNPNDNIVVDVAGLNLPINNAQQASFTQVTDATQAGAWNNSANQFLFNVDHNELWYSSNGTAGNAIDLAHISTGIPLATAVHVA